jgi:hypothetical protein
MMVNDGKTKPKIHQTIYQTIWNDNERYVGLDHEHLNRSTGDVWSFPMGRCVFLFQFFMSRVATMGHLELGLAQM